MIPAWAQDRKITSYICYHHLNSENNSYKVIDFVVSSTVKRCFLFFPMILSIATKQVFKLEDAIGILYIREIPLTSGKAGSIEGPSEINF